MKKTNWKTPHAFTPDGSKGINGEPLCTCGLNETYAIHGKEPDDMEARFEKFFREITDERKWINGKPVVYGVMYVTVFNGILAFLRSERSLALKEGAEGEIKRIKRLLVDPRYNYFDQHGDLRIDIKKLIDSLK